MRLLHKLVTLALFTLIITGCTNQKFKPEYRSQIHTVKILPVVWSTKDITYMGREQAWGAALGAGRRGGRGGGRGDERLSLGNGRDERRRFCGGV